MLDVRNLWRTELDKLLAWLDVIDTDPKIGDAIKAHLSYTFLQEDILVRSCTTSVTNCLIQQQAIRWVSFLEGFISSEWHKTQQ